MYYELWSDIMFIKNITRLQKGETKATKRTKLDNMKISGHFIIDASPTSIYTKFKRHFNGSAPNFNCTPDDIVKLSKLNSEAKLTGLYNRSLFINLQRPAEINL